MSGQSFSKLPVDKIKLGIRFSAPVFFDDGINMFLAEGKTVKPYHLNSIIRWKISYLLTYGHVIHDTQSIIGAHIPELENVEEVEELN